MKTRILGLLSFGLMALLATDARANLVLNGEFQSPTVGSGFQTFAVGSTGITSWTVVSGVANPGSGSVDLISPTYFPSSDGVGQSVDLDGTGSSNVTGGISQSITGLITGATYTLQFFYANNPAGASSSANVSIGSLTTSITHSGSVGTSLATMNYTTGTYTFTALGTTQLLSFVSTDPSADQNGIVLDNVSINLLSVPEPASCAMLGLGLLAAGVYTRSRRRTA
jgi:hypothetical protein